MEVFAIQPGSVESLRKANDIPGNNSTYRNLNQHCSACARVKRKKEPCVNPDLQTQFLSMPPVFQIDCVVHFKPEYVLASLPQPNPHCADLALSLQPSLSDLLPLYTNVTNLEFLPFILSQCVFNGNLRFSTHFLLMFFLIIKHLISFFQETLQG